MKTLHVDAIKVEPQDYLPEYVLAADGHQYRVLGVVVSQSTCVVPVMESAADVLGRRLCVLLGERRPDPPPPENVAGYVSQGSGV